MSPVKLKVRITNIHTGRSIDVIAIANTGFITEFPEVAIPINLVKSLDFEYPPKDSIEAEIETGGGVTTVITIPKAVKVKVITSDRESNEVIANLMINPYIEDVLLSDALLEELGIQILYPKRGLWKFIDEDKVRESIT